MKLLLCGMVIVPFTCFGTFVHPVEPKDFDSSNFFFNKLKGQPTETKLLYYFLYSELKKALGVKEIASKNAGESKAQTMDERANTLLETLPENNPLKKKFERIFSGKMFQFDKLRALDDFKSIAESLEKEQIYNKKDFFTNIYLDIAEKFSSNKPINLFDIIGKYTPDELQANITNLKEKVTPKLSAIDFSTTPQTFFLSVIDPDNNLSEEEKYIAADLYTGVHPESLEVSFPIKELGNSVKEAVKTLKPAAPLESSIAGARHLELKQRYPFSEIIEAAKNQADKAKFIKDLLSNWMELIVETELEEGGTEGAIFKSLKPKDEPKSEETKGEVEDLTKDLEDLTQALFALIPPKK